jgi:hypothetical protein
MTEARRGIDTGRGAPYAGGRRGAEVDGSAQSTGGDDDETLLHRLAPFLIAGLKAPLPDFIERDGEDAAWFRLR